MALIRQFYNEEFNGGGNESFSLARDVLTERVFVFRCKTWQADGAIQYDETKQSLAEFFQQDGQAQRELLSLIGTLVIET